MVIVCSILTMSFAVIRCKNDIVRLQTNRLCFLHRMTKMQSFGMCVLVMLMGHYCGALAARKFTSLRPYYTDIPFNVNVHTYNRTFVRELLAKTHYIVILATHNKKTTCFGSVT